MTDQVREIFDAMVAADESLDEVIVALRNVGVRVSPDQRLIVSAWLDLFPINTLVPTRCRIMVLRRMLERAKS